MDNKIKRIGTFKQFLKEQKQRKLNEEKIHLEIEWWDTCIQEVLDNCKNSCNGILDYEQLVKYIKNKYIILGREEPGYEEELLLQHFKDLIFQFHGDSLYTTASCDWGENNAEVHAKGLVVGELAKTILDKVLDTIKTDDDPIPGVTSASLIDRPKEQPDTSIDDNGTIEYDDLPFESKKVRPVKGFKAFTKALNETVAIMDIAMDCHKKCINYCLDRIQKEVGSYKPEEILNVASQVADPRVKARIVLLYVKEMVIDYLSGEKAQLGVVDVNGNKGKDIPKEVWEQGLDKLCQDIADEVLVALAEMNGISLSDGKVE